MISYEKTIKKDCDRLALITEKFKEFDATITKKYITEKGRVGSKRKKGGKR